MFVKTFSQGSLLIFCSILFGGCVQSKPVAAKFGQGRIVLNKTSEADLQKANSSPEGKAAREAMMDMTPLEYGRKILSLAERTIGDNEVEYDGTVFFETATAMREVVEFMEDEGYGEEQTYREAISQMDPKAAQLLINGKTPEEFDMNDAMETTSLYLEKGAIAVLDKYYPSEADEEFENDSFAVAKSSSRVSNTQLRGPGGAGNPPATPRKSRTVILREAQELPWKRRTDPCSGANEFSETAKYVGFAGAAAAFYTGSNRVGVGVATLAGATAFMYEGMGMVAAKIGGCTPGGTYNPAPLR